MRTFIIEIPNFSLDNLGGFLLLLVVCLMGIVRKTEAQNLNSDSLLQAGINLYQSQQPIQALPIFEKIIAYEEAKDSTDLRLLSAANAFKGECLTAVGKIEESLVFFRQSIALDTKRGVSNNLPNSYHRIGKVHMAQGRLDSAKTNLELSLLIGEEEMHPMFKAEIHNMLSDAKRGLADSTYITHVRSALNAVKRFEAPPQAKPQVANMLAMIYMKLADVQPMQDSARYYADLGLTNARIAGNRPIQGHLNNLLGKQLVKHNKPDSALMLASTTINICSQTGNYYDLIDAYFIKTQAFVLLNDTDSTTVYENKAIDVAKLSNMLELAGFNYTQLSAITFFQSRDPILAIDFGKKALRIAEERNDEKLWVVAYESVLSAAVKKPSMALQFADSCIEHINSLKSVRDRISLRSLLYQVYNKFPEMETVAIELVEENLEESLTTGNWKEAENSISNLVYLYNRNYQFEKSLAIIEDYLNDHDDTSGQIEVSRGSTYQKWGKLNESLVSYQNAESIASKNENSTVRSLAIGFQSILWSMLGVLDSARYYSLKSIDERIYSQEDLQTRKMESLAQVYGSTSKPDSAIYYYKELLNRKTVMIDRHQVLMNLSWAYGNKGTLDSAFVYLNMAIEECDNHEECQFAKKQKMAFLMSSDFDINKPESFQSLPEMFNRMMEGEDPFLTNILQAYKGYIMAAMLLVEIPTKHGLKLTDPNANVYFDKALEDTTFRKSILAQLEKAEVALFNLEQMRDEIPEGDREEFTSQFSQFYDILTEFYGMIDNTEAFYAAERSRANSLRDRLGQTVDDFRYPTPEELDDKTAIIIFNQAAPVAGYNIQILTSDGYAFDRSSVAPLTQGLNDYKSTFNKLQPDYRLALKDRGFIPVPSAISHDEEKPTGSLFNMVRDSINVKSDAIASIYHKLISSPSTENIELVDTISKALYNTFFSGLAGHIISTRSKLVIIPTGMLSYIPFETLMDSSGQYLGEKFEISYAYSLGTWVEMQENDGDYKMDSRVLAVGAAVYNKDTYSTDMSLPSAEDSKKSGVGAVSISRNQALDLKNKVLRLNKVSASFANVYESINLDQWTNLSGTLSEVLEIKKQFPYADTLLGWNANEHNLKKLSVSGELMKYEVIHFSTHGVSIADVPELSAIVLSPDEKEDGYLRFDEIANLNISADFVNLSACETGIGKLLGGEGMIGLSYAFTAAGAKGVSSSLWQVADNSTSIFMNHVYQKVRTDGDSYKKAINEVKREFIKGIHGEKYKLPYYWAPFLYYGL